MKTFIGLKSAQFESVLTAAMPSLRRVYKKEPDKARCVLYIYLMKLRTSHVSCAFRPMVLLLALLGHSVPVRMMRLFY